jgi:chromosome segregation ATPase
MTTDPHRPEEAEEVERRLEECSQRLADLFEELARVSAQGEEPAESPDDPAERERLRLQGTGPRREAVAREILRLNDELSRLSARLGALQPGGARQLSPREKEIMELQSRLLEIADAQNEAVRRWNRNPVEEERGPFEEELRRLHREYGDALSRLDELKGTHQDGGAKGA